jgi:DNA-binding MltR family transcriptional regulator
MKKKRAVSKAKKSARKPRAPSLKLQFTDEELRRLEIAAGAEGRDVVEFSKSVLSRAARGIEKRVGKSGNRTQPNESVPPAGYKSAAPPRRGRLAASKRRTSSREQGSQPNATSTATDKQRQARLSAQLAEWRKTHPGVELSLERIIQMVVQNLAECSPRNADSDFVFSCFLETDRGCVMVASQLFSETLEELLRKFFREKSGDTESELDFWFVGGNPPLRSGGLKIRIAFHIGLIDRHVFSSLTELQRVRSRIAAHSTAPFQLTMDMVMGIVKKLDQHSQDLFASMVDGLDMAAMSARLRAFMTPARIAFLFTVPLLVKSIENQSGSTAQIS